MDRVSPARLHTGGPPPPLVSTSLTFPLHLWQFATTCSPFCLLSVYLSAAASFILYLISRASSFPCSSAWPQYAAARGYSKQDTPPPTKASQLLFSSEFSPRGYQPALQTGQDFFTVISMCTRGSTWFPHQVWAQISQSTPPPPLPLTHHRTFKNYQKLRACERVKGGKGGWTTAAIRSCTSICLY